MATLYISEYANLSTVGGGGQGIHRASVGSLPNVLAFNSATITASSSASSQLTSKTQYVRLCSDTSCFIAFSQGTSTATTASITSQYLPANQIEYIAVQPNGWISAIA